MKEKSEAFIVFKSLKLCMEIETRRDIKNLLIDPKENNYLRYLMNFVRVVTF